MTQQELESFARFIKQPVAVARQILAQEEADEARYGRQDVHDGYDYAAQRWVA